MQQKIHLPIGARPGSLVIPETASDPRVRQIVYNKTAIDEEPVFDLASPVALVFPEKKDGTSRWIDIQGFGDEKVLRQIGSAFSIHPLALEDVVNVPGRPKFEDYDDQILIVTRRVAAIAVSDGSVEIEQIGLVLGINYVLSFQEHHGDAFEPVTDRLRAGKGPIRRTGSDYLAYALWDAVIDTFPPAIETLMEALEHLEEEILYRPRPDVPERLSRIRGMLSALRRSIQPQRDAVQGLLRGENQLVSDQVRVYLRDVQDHAVHAVEAIDAAREMASHLMSLYLSALSHRTNEVMRFLTIVTSIFVPLTFLAGIYGMNFQYMPELGQRWGYPVLLGIMLVAAISLIVFFRRKGWLGSARYDDESNG